RVARRLDRDGAGRPMPWWSGCAELGSGEYFLLMAESPASFDGRYFGVSEADDIVGKARLIWRR
ncbi:S26 family signal peptidase, partial [Sphingopyxis sp.]|uniref:S26 family signal peptidase n=1 Tax=Sphingopyxis sp. TaxID=1908224 RepID=UPI002623C51A